MGTQTKHAPFYKRIENLEVLIEKNRVKLKPWQKVYIGVKRVVDTILSLFALLVLSPVLVTVFFLIKISSPSEPVLFTQLRVGRNYKVFKLYKFRSMSSHAPKNVASAELQDVDEYLTTVGRFIRKTSIDELPQLFNVIKGDMSLVGPRPLICTEREIRFLRRYYGIYQVRPGITGQAQINGRDYVSAYVKVAFDRYYLEHFNPWMDIKMVCRTMVLVMLRAGVVEGAPNTPEQEEQLLDAFAKAEEERAKQMV